MATKRKTIAHYRAEIVDLFCVNLELKEKLLKAEEALEACDIVKLSKRLKALEEKLETEVKRLENLIENNPWTIPCSYEH
jgi:hypothetical protein